MKKWFSYFLDNFGKHWVTFYSIIWSHCPPPIHTQLRWPNCWDIVAPFNLCKKFEKPKSWKTHFHFFLLQSEFHSAQLFWILQILPLSLSLSLTLLTMFRNRIKHLMFSQLVFRIPALLQLINQDEGLIFLTARPT